MTDKTRKKDNVMGLRPGRGHDQYAGRVAGGESGGGAYPNPHSGSGDAGDAAAPAAGHGGQSHQGYYGGGQAGARPDRDGDDHHAASRETAPDDPGPDYRDHASQRGGKARADFDAAIARAEADRG